MTEVLNYVSTGSSASHDYANQEYNPVESNTNRSFEDRDEPTTEVVVRRTENLGIYVLIG